MNFLAVNSPYQIFTDTDGEPLEAGYIYIGEANKNPITDAIEVYWDSNFLYPAAQPIRTIGGYPRRNGTPSNIYINFIAYESYSILIKDKNQEIITYKTEVMVSDLYTGINVRTFGAVGDGVTDDSAAFQAAADLAFYRRGGTIIVPPSKDAYVVNTEITVAYETGAEQYTGGVFFKGEPASDQNSIYGSYSKTTIKKTSGAGGIFKFSSIINCGIKNMCLTTETSNADYIINVDAFDSPAISSHQFILDNVLFRNHYVSTVDAQVILTSAKNIAMRDVHFLDGESDCIRVGDDQGTYPTLMNGKVESFFLSNCIFEGDIDLRNCFNIEFNNCQWFPRRISGGGGHGAKIKASGDEKGSGVIFVNCKADNDGDDIGTFFTQGTNAENLLVLGGSFGDYDKMFELNGSGYAIFQSPSFRSVNSANTGDIEINSDDITLIDNADHKPSLSNGVKGIVDNRTDFGNIVKIVKTSNQNMTALNTFETILSDTQRIRGGLYRLTYKITVQSNDVPLTAFRSRVTIGGSTIQHSASWVTTNSSSQMVELKHFTIIKINSYTSPAVIALQVKQTSNAYATIIGNTGAEYGDTQLILEPI